MKANELMVGDWVYNRIADINFQVYPQFFSQWHNKPKQFEATIQPIPLTAEILEKNGFGLIGEKFVFGEIDDALVELNLSINNSYRVKISVADLMTSHNGWIGYVHELQHALRLCCVEKEITL